MFVNLPLTVNGYETMNQTEVDCPEKFTVGDNNDNFELKSAVFAELLVPVMPTGVTTGPLVSKNEIVVGTSAIVKNEAGVYYAYRPVLIHTPLISGNRSSPQSSPVTELIVGKTDANGLPDVDANPHAIINARGLVVFYKRTA